MPTEHEFKYVLDPTIAFMENLDERSSAFAVIRQGYLADVNLRVRMMLNHNGQQWYLTFKQKVPDRTIEIEIPISVRDGMDLWEISERQVKKNRYYIVHSGLTWEVDILYGDEEVYFALMEVELDEGAPRPEGVPDFIKKYIVYEVPLTDDRFSNKKLGDVEYAKNLYATIQGG